MRAFGRWALLGSLVLGVAVSTAQAPQKQAPLPKPTLLISPCGVSTIEAELQGHQLVRIPASQIGAVSCSDTSVLPPVFRAKVRCVLTHMEAGGWHPKVQETYRSNERQAFLWSYSRTRPGPRVTNAKTSITSSHGYFLAVDIVDRYKGWDNPRFFKWLVFRYEECGLTPGGKWVTFVDAPHGQFLGWAGSPPAWAQALARQDSVQVVLQRLRQL